MRVIEGIVDRPADLDWDFMPAKTFYDKMRQGVRFTTAQITRQDYAEHFEKYITDGCDVISISCSSDDDIPWWEQVPENTKVRIRR